jgi:hypothetical protein
MPDTVRAGTLPPDQVDDGAQAVWARFELRARQAGLAQRFSPHDGQRTSIGNRSTPAPTSQRSGRWPSCVRCHDGSLRPSRRGSQTTGGEPAALPMARATEGAISTKLHCESARCAGLCQAITWKASLRCDRTHVSARPFRGISSGSRTMTWCSILEKAASERVGSIPYEIWDLHAESKPGPTDSAGGPLLVLQRQSACRERLKRVGR